MANIKVKRSAVPGKVPLVGDLALGEFAVNTHDGKVYTKKNVDGIETIVTVNPDGVALENLQSRYSYTVSGSAQGTFAASYVVPYVDVYQNGSRLATGDYTATDGSSVVLAVAAQPGDVVEIVALNSYTANSDFLNVPGGIATADFLKFDVAATNTPEVAKLNWNADEGTLEFGLKGGQVVLQVGQEQVQRIYNNTGSTLVPGQVVYVTGSQGNRLTVALASASGEATSTRTFGIVTETILNEAEGFITTSGLVRGLNTSSFAEGSVLWLGTTAGTYTTTRPTAPNHGVLVAFVVRQHASVGSVFVHVANGYELDELHDVLIASKQDGQALVYEASSGLWKNKFVDYNTLLNKPTLVTQTDINNAIAALVDTAPATLDTLNELAAALGDDPNFATTITNSLAGKQATLVSGTNIKTVNGTSILGSGNIQIDGGVTSFNTRTGAVTLSSSDVTTALGYTPYNSTNPSGYITSSASITGNAATATALQTARTINGVSFDGTANITVADSTKLPLSGGNLTGSIRVNTTGSVSETSHVIIKRSGQTTASFGSYQGAWRSGLEIWNNDSTKMLFLNSAESDSGYANIKSVGGGFFIDVGSNGGTRAIQIEASGAANFPQSLTQGGNQVLHAGNYSSYALPLSGGTVTGNLNVNDGNLQLYKAQTVDMSNTSVYSTSNFYPVLIGVPTSGCWIEIQNNLNSNVPSWSTHGGGFTLNLRWWTNGSGWGTTEVKRRVEQYHERFTNATICGGISQLGNSSQEVVWLRGGGQYYFRFSRNLIAYPQSSTYTLYGETASVVSSIVNSVWNSATGTHISYYNNVHAGTDIRAPIFYDNNDTGYYLDPTSTTSLRTVGDWRADSAAWSGDFAGKMQYHSGNWYLQFLFNMIFRNSSGSNIMTCDSSGNVTFSGNVTAYSDARLKENVVTVDSALAKVTALRGVYYNKIGDEKRRVGVIAQEVKKILPEVVRTINEKDPTTGKESNMLAVDYGNMVGLLIEAIKEQDKKINRLEALVEKLLGETK